MAENKTVETSSPSGTIDKTGWIKIGKGALIAAGGALLTYAVEVIPGINLGPVWTPIVMVVSSVLINAARKLLVNYQ